jgi:hypothetical protein
LEPILSESLVKCSDPAAARLLQVEGRYSPALIRWPRSVVFLRLAEVLAFSQVTPGVSLR